MLKEIDDCSERLVKEGTTGLVIGSMDVKALYTSLDQLTAAKDIKEERLRLVFDARELNMNIPMDASIFPTPRSSEIASIRP